MNNDVPLAMEESGGLGRSLVRPAYGGTGQEAGAPVDARRYVRDSEPGQGASD